MHSNNILWIIIRRMRTPLLVIIFTFSLTILGLVLIPGVDSNGHPYHMNFLDAVYFVSFMASTIGFGEVPYEFTYAQRLWVLFSIYISVIGWFYAIGALVALIQDQNLILELKVSKFRKKIKYLKEPFVIILGYNNTTKELIHRLSQDNKRIVVIDKNQEKIDELELENFIPEVYAIKTNVDTPNALRLAGIKKRNCKGVITLFNDDFKNTKIALLVKLLNKNVNIVVKSSTKEQTEHLANLGIKNIVNPFHLIAHRFYLARSAPKLWLLEMLMFGHDLYIHENESLPQGKYIICGYGRMGKALRESLYKSQTDCSFIDLHSASHKERKNSAIYGDAEDYQTLIDAGVKDAAVIIAATKDDLINLTILLTAKKINPDIYTVGRENTLDDITIFNSAKIDRIYILETIIAEYAHRLISMPLVPIFLQEVYKQDNEWGKKVITELKHKTDYKPEIFETRIVKSQAYALTQYLKDGNSINLGLLARDLSDRNKRGKILFLMVKNRKEEITLLPDDNYNVKVSDRFLIAATSDAREDFELIINNVNELYYVRTGEELTFGIMRNLFSTTAKKKSKEKEDA